MTAAYDALTEEVVDLVLTYQGAGVGSPHDAVRAAIMRVFPPLTGAPMGDDAENNAARQTLVDAAMRLQAVSEKCCECTDGHHDQRSAYGTDSDVHVSRDTARALASWLNTASADLWAHGPLCCADGCEGCDDSLWMPHVRRALSVARGVLTGSVSPPVTDQGASDS